MSELPKIARQRMAQAAAGQHPDADLLTAFAEQALTSAEREEVMQHLANCAQCRDVVALALPQEAATHPAPAVAEHAWWTWPALRWAAMGASVVVVAAAVLLFRPEAPRPGPRVAASRQESAPAAQTPVPQKQPEPRVSASVPAAKVAPPAAPPKKQKVIAPSQPAAVAHKQEDKAKDQVGAMQSVGTLAKAPVEAESRPVPAAQPRVFEAAREQAPAATGGPRTVLAQKPAANSAVRRADAVLASAARTGDLGQAPNARWTVSGTGVVERSVDSGATWQPVAISVGARFHTVASIGDEVWAGGPNGVLYHSRDGGATWTRVKVPFTGDILRIEFRDPQRGTATTPRETWVTADGGGTWTRLQPQ